MKEAFAESILKAEGYPLVMRKEHLCRLLDIHENTLYHRIKSGDVPAYRRVGHGPKARYEWLRPHVETWLLHRKAA
jgi:hypothetical protein